MNERLKELRKALGLTQQEFAEKLKTSRNNIAGYEIGTRKPSDAAINNLCNTFHVNENWLRDGTGEMFVHISRDTQIATFIGNIQMDEKNNSFKKKLISVLANLTEDQWEVLADIAEKLSNEKD